MNDRQKRLLIGLLVRYRGRSREDALDAILHMSDFARKSLMRKLLGRVAKEKRCTRTTGNRQAGSSIRQTVKQSASTISNATAEATSMLNAWSQPGALSSAKG